ncbi:T9SS type A sorting domain-containing protein [Hymenobacter rubidus]|uniref:T9SS type A sorting domain-containing protein n=1 Tax=Hymenobacter rubidus TaxID=1441626 RepID=UPI00191F1EA2|nr:T9SS type A sorting domain-containing protein [Hymenobacter rubidus]
MTNRFTLLIILALSALNWPAVLLAQTLDPAFQPTLLKATYTAGLQSAPQFVVAQPDGKLLVSGGFDFMNGTISGKIQRLNPDGTVDSGFNAGGVGANGFVAAMVLQPNGKIMIGGGFTAYNGVPAFTVARLNANGTLDTSFSPSGPMATVRRQVGALAVQPDGKILVGGSGSLSTGLPDGGLYRLNTDGTPDATFNIGTGASSTGAFVRSLFVQADGKILVGGLFTAFSGQTVGNLVRLNSNGSLDTGFAIGTGFDSTVRTIAQQADGKLLLGGSFATLNGQAAPRLVRVLLNGTLDNTFAATTGAGTVYKVLIQSNGGAQFNGSIVYCGSFTQVNGQTRNRLARVFDNGTPDASFGAGAGANNIVSEVEQIGTGQFVAAGYFTQFDGLAKTGLARVTATGANEPSFTATAEVRGTVSSAIPLTSGQLLVSGNFTDFNGTAAGSSPVRRLNANGTLDASYSTTYSPVFNGMQPDGSFYTYTVSGTQYLFQRVLPSGALDNTFTGLLFGSTAVVNPAPVQGLTVQPDGRILVYGNFTTFGGAARNAIARLNANGTLDNAFLPPASTVTRYIGGASVQPSGKIVFTYVEAGTGAAVGTLLARLNPDGTLDNTFNIGTGPTAGSAYSILMQPDGRLLLGGSFTSFNGQSTPVGLVRLDVNGAIDNTFAPTTAASLYLIQPDGRILAKTGTLNGTDALVRLNANGSLDTSFPAVSIPLAIFSGDDTFFGLALQPTDSKIIVYGNFRSVAGQPRIGLARLTNTVLATRSAASLLPLVAYPNPTSQRLTVLLPASAKAGEAVLLDLTGRAVRSWPLPTSQPEATLDLNTVAAGVYVLRIPGTTDTYQQKVVVTH